MYGKGGNIKVCASSFWGMFRSMNRRKVMEIMWKISGSNRIYGSG